MVIIPNHTKNNSNERQHKMKKSLSILLAAVMLFTGCGAVDKAKETLGKAESVIDSKSLAKDEDKEIFKYLKSKDIDKLTALFSKSAGSEQGLKKEWESFFEFIDGNIESYKFLDFPGEGMTIDKNGEITDSHLDIEYKNVNTDTGAVYDIGYYQSRKYPKKTDIEGINLFYVYIYDDEGVIEKEITVGRMPTE